MRVLDLIEYGKKLLKENDIEDFALKSKRLAKFILNMNDQEIIQNMDKEIEEDDKTRFYLAIIEVISGMPLQYITNSQEFYGLDFYVDENVLIPQPDTEILVEEVIRIINENNKENMRILDICTGSGCIGISISKNVEDAKITLLDVSKDALNIAEKNANKILGNLSNIKFIESDMFDEVEEEYDIIVSNPPYIAKTEWEDLSSEVQKEPFIALYGGEDGLDFYKILIEEAQKYLSDDGYLCLEIGYKQREEVIELLKENENYYNIYSKKDLSGNDRIVIAQRKPEN